MIDWQCTAISEPPVMQGILTAVIENHIKLKMPIKTFPMFPCHTPVRAVKLVTEASACIENSWKRDGCIIAKYQSRKKILHFESKKDFLI